MTTGTIAGRIAAAVRKAARHNGRGDLDCNIEKCVPRGAIVLGNLSVFNQYLFAEMETALAEANAASQAAKLAKERLEAVRAAFFDSIRGEVAVPDDSAGLGIGPGWTVYSLTPELAEMEQNGMMHSNDEMRRGIASLQEILGGRGMTIG